VRIEDISSIQNAISRIQDISSTSKKIEMELEQKISESSKPEFLLELEKQRKVSELPRASEPGKEGIDKLTSILQNANPQFFNKQSSHHIPHHNDQASIKPKAFNLEDLIHKESTRKGLDPDLVKAIIKAESNFNPRAESPKGAMGLMQLMPSTADSLGVENPFNPAQNIKGGTNYLKDLLRVFKDKDLAIAAYNAGPGAVKKHGGIPPYSETINYVKKVNEYYDDFKD
jgi:soluble lytic murein transglycosylase-like protein